MNYSLRTKLWLAGALTFVGFLLHITSLLLPLLRFTLIATGVGLLCVAGSKAYAERRSIPHATIIAAPWVAYGLVLLFVSAWFKASVPVDPMHEPVTVPTDIAADRSAAEQQQCDACLAYWTALRTSDQHLVDGFESLKGNEPTIENFSALRAIFTGSAAKLQSASPSNVHSALLDVGEAQLRALNTFVEYCDRGISHEREVAEVKERANSWKFLVDSAASGFSGVFGGDAFKPVRDVQNQADALSVEAQAMQEQRLEALASFNRVAEIRNSARNSVAIDLNYELPPY